MNINIQNGMKVKAKAAKIEQIPQASGKMVLWKAKAKRNHTAAKRERCKITFSPPFYLVPKYKNIIPISTKAKSTALLLKFFSRKSKAPKRKETMTLPRRIMETMEIIESSWLKA